MYTQCDKCKAIFEVSMREVTVASGKLRCGECNAVFDVMATLSTTMPEPYSETSKEPAKIKTQQASNSSVENINETTLPSSSQTEISKQQTIRPEFDQSILKKVTREIKSNKWLNIFAYSLAALLIVQVLYNNRHYFTSSPIHEPTQIKMISNNVFAHPNEDGVLLISASIENVAERIQYYPVLEVSLTDADSKLVALRRFKPSEYLEDYHQKMVLDINKPANLKLKIADPGNEAIHFEFKFL